MTLVLALSGVGLLGAGLTAQSPVTDAVRAAASRAAQNLPAAADEMPADKFSFKPTPTQMTFAELLLHVARSNARLCSVVSSSPAPELPKLAPTDPKDTIVALLKQTFSYCTGVLGGLDDAKLADSVPFFGGRKVTRAAALLDLVADWADHYSQAAAYLRLNGLLPPTARRDEM